MKVAVSDPRPRPNLHFMARLLGLGDVVHHTVGGHAHLRAESQVSSRLSGARPTSYLLSLCSPVRRRAIGMIDCRQRNAEAAAAGMQPERSGSTNVSVCQPAEQAQPATLQRNQ
jgi:hypothetical protein